MLKNPFEKPIRLLVHRLSVCLLNAIIAICLHVSLVVSSYMISGLLVVLGK